MTIVAGRRAPSDVERRLIRNRTMWERIPVSGAPPISESDSGVRSRTTGQDGCDLGPRTISDNFRRPTAWPPGQRAPVRSGRSRARARDVLGDRCRGADLAIADERDEE